MFDVRYWVFDDLFITIGTLYFVLCTWYFVLLGPYSTRGTVNPLSCT